MDYNGFVVLGSLLALLVFFDVCARLVELPLVIRIKRLEADIRELRDQLHTITTKAP